MTPFDDPSGLLAIASAGMIVVMSLAWFVVRAKRDGGWIDVLWSFGTGALGVVFALTPVSESNGIGWRQAMVACLVGAWGLRLGVYLANRVARGPEDARYRAMRAAWSSKFLVFLFGFAIIQAFVAVFLALAVRLAAMNAAPGFRIFDGLGIAVFAVAILGEGLADRQLWRFKANPANDGKLCDAGLWSWSRHPNYFFEWLFWIGYALIAIGPGGTGWSWLSLLGPAFMLWLLLRVSGIPPLERHMVASRGEAYRAYQMRTSAFIPLPPTRARSR